MNRNSFCDENNYFQMRTNIQKLSTNPIEACVCQPLASFATFSLYFEEKKILLFSAAYSNNKSKRLFDNTSLIAAKKLNWDKNYTRLWFPVIFSTCITISKHCAILLQFIELKRNVFLSYQPQKCQNTTHRHKKREKI